MEGSERGKARQRSASRGKSKEGSGTKRADQSTSASANAAESVALPPVVGSPNHRAASMTLASMSMAAPATPVLASGTAAEGQALTGSDKGADTDAESKAAVDDEETARMKDRERKRKERGAAAAAKPIQGKSSTSASTLMPARSSPRKSPKQSLCPGPVSVLNWSPSDDVRMVLVACSPQMQQLFGMVGHASNRGELPASNSSTDARPTTAFLEQLVF